MHAALLVYISCLLQTIYVLAESKETWYNPITEQCYHCICMSKMSCNASFGCKGRICGPFGITHPFWVDAGSPVLPEETTTDKRAFARCVNDFTCAKTTVKQYMERFGRDCDRDRVITCTDYFLLHMHGMESCNIQHTYQKSQEEISFMECLKQTS